MRSSLYIVAALAALTLVCVSGCRRATPTNWEIIAQNKTSSACEVSVDTGYGTGLHAPDLGGGERRVLSTGSAKTTVHSVKVVRNRQDQTLRPEVEVAAGKRFVVLVEADGKVSTALSDQ